MIPLDLALRLRVIRRAAGMLDVLLLQPTPQFATDVKGPVIREPSWPMPYPGFGQACRLQGIFQVTVTFDIRGREYNGRYFNNLQGWKIVSIGGEPTATQEEQSSPYPTPSDFGDDDIPF